ncbi:amidohydrolase family protein [Variovorax sp. OV329]|uniref:amidohydrolase family protein n=1 Tax=Variovorax sp. OV329 TaxID=1882825 RepID=UPI0008EA4E8C|nr:amidohydrolase family protein [Variovorax sp. OV329]SFN48825.1 cytosine deaminase [Variovorax sp. OV329]
MTPAAAAPSAIRRVRPPGHEGLADLLIENGRIAALLPAGTAPPELPTLADGEGRLMLLPALVESHIHFDKTLWGAPWRPNSSGPTRNHRIANEQAVLKDFPLSLAERAGPLIEHCVARGSLHFRSHVDVQPAFGIARIEEMLALRQRYAHLVDMQLVAFPQAGLITAPGTADLMEHALALGLEVVGGIDPSGIDHNPVRHLEAVFDLAVRFGRGIDIHLHDGGELGRFEIERIADMTEAHGLAGRVVISHAYALGAFAPAELYPLADRLARAGISIMSCAPSHFMAPPLAMLRSRGVNVCSGSDNVRDTWSPMGNGDMLDRARLIAMRFGWSKDEQLADAFDIVTHGGAKALGLGERYGIAPGCDADLLLLPAESIAHAVVSCPLERTVIRRGRVVARDGVLIADAALA